MRISDWSSDVCSSDLDLLERLFRRQRSSPCASELANDIVDLGLPILVERIRTTKCGRSVWSGLVKRPADVQRGRIQHITDVLLRCAHREIALTNFAAHRCAEIAESPNRQRL